MSGTSPVGSWLLTNFTSMLGSTYKASIDANFAVAQRVADNFAPHPSSPADMNVHLDAGFVVQVGPDGTQHITEVAAQSVAISAAPASPNNRIDLVYVDAKTGTVGVSTGSPAGSPVAPVLLAGKLQIAQVSVPNGTSAIASSNITDLRSVWSPAALGVPFAIASGTVNAITATFTPPTPTLGASYDGYMWKVRSSGANTGATTYSPDGQTALAVNKAGASALVANDIPAANYDMLLQYHYNGGAPYFELMNPYPQVTSVAGRVGAVTLAATDIAGTAWTQTSLTNNNQLSNGSNFAVRGENVSEFNNNAGYTSWGTVLNQVSGYDQTGSYFMLDAAGGNYNVNSTYSGGPLPPGSWRCMGAQAHQTPSTVCGQTDQLFLFVRYA